MMTEDLFTLLFDDSLWGLLPLIGGFFGKVKRLVKKPFSVAGDLIGGLSGGITGPGYQTSPIDIDQNLFQMGQTSDGASFAQAMQAQEELRQRAEARARGEGPSVGQMQLQRGLEGATQSQLAMASGSRNPLAARQASQNIAGLQQGVAGDAAILGAQEQLMAEQQLMEMQQMQNQMVQFYESMGFSRDQAQLAANQELARLRAGTDLGLQEIQAGAVGSTQRGRAGIVSGAMQGVGSFLGLR